MKTAKNHRTIGCVSIASKGEPGADGLGMAVGELHDPSRLRIARITNIVEKRAPISVADSGDRAADASIQTGQCAC